MSEFRKKISMNIYMQKKTVDYPFLITLGGIGLLVALAGLMLGLALGSRELAFSLAAGGLIIAAAVIAGSLYRGRGDSALPNETLSVTRMTQPQAITSLDGELVYCNAPYRAFLKEDMKCEVLSPVKLMTDDQVARFRDLLSGLERGQESALVAQLARDGADGKYVRIGLSRMAGQDEYVSWVLDDSIAVTSPENADPGANLFNLDQLGSLLDYSDCGLMAVAPDGQITYVNNILLHWLSGESDGQLSLPLALSEILAADMAQLNGRLMVRSLSGGEIPLEFLPLDEALGEASQLKSASEETALFLVSSCQADAAYFDVNPEDVNIDRFFRESPIGIAIVTEKGEVLERNQIFRKYVQQLNIKDTRNLKHIIDAAEYQEFYDKIQATLTSGQASSIADVGFRGEGEKHGQFYITRLENFSDHKKVVILYLIDTTEQKNLELQFAQSQKMQAVGQLAGGVAHDFNNLLTAIIGFSDLLLVRHGPGDLSFSDIIQIKQNANRAANLVRQLLAFSRQQTLRPKVLIITDVLAELSNLLGRLIGDGIELDMKHGRDLGQVKVDQGQMEQVIINLCVNARDAMDNKGKISISTRNISLSESKKLSERYQVMPQDEYILLEVTDTGCGIAKEHLGKIFEPFFSTKEVGKGTGLGLSTVYGIVKQTDGFIFPTSDIGKGTTFSIYLPVYKEQQKSAANVDEAAREGDKASRDLTGKGTIMLVEDEEAVRMFASRALKNKGYKVFEANSGEAAVSLFEKIEGELDLLISDVVMPLMDGPTLVRKIRETNKKLKVIFISGYAEDAFDETPRDEDFHFLPKPFSLKQLAEKVKEVLDNS